MNLSKIELFKKAAILKKQLLRKSSSFVNSYSIEV